jgi:cell wall-associated NlpC family hydrolase/transposase-like protein
MVLGLFTISLVVVGTTSQSRLSGAPAVSAAAAEPAVGADSTLVSLRSNQRFITHVVAPGETVSALAERYGVTANTIRWANGLDPASETLLPGMRLTILPLSGVLHVVREGETVEEVAARYQSVAEAIRSVNSVAAGQQPAAGTVLLVPGGRPATVVAEASRFRPSSRSMLRPQTEGETFAVLVPSAANAPAAATPAPTATPTLAPTPSPTPAAAPGVVARRYAVEAGDTILSIAGRFGVSAEAIIASNNLSEADLLSIGQELLIPAQEGFVYMVREGDMLREIAERYGTSAQSIIGANRLQNPDMLLVGEHLLIPGYAAAERAAEEILAPIRAASAARAVMSSRSGERPAPASRTYTVREGDTLRDIAQRFGLTPLAIAQANGLEAPYMLQIGMQLTIPGGGSPAPAAAPAAPAPRPAPAAAAPAPAPRPAPAAAPQPAAPPPSAAGGSVVSFARQFVGYPYVFGGASPRGFDCSGFVWYVFRNAGRWLPRDLYGQWQSGVPVSYANLQPGDIVFFSNTYIRGLSHNGIYIGGGMFIHAQSEGTGVRITSMAEPYWASRYTGARRLP